MRENIDWDVCWWTREGEENRKRGGRYDSERYEEGGSKWKVVGGRVKWKSRTRVDDPK